VRFTDAVRLAEALGFELSRRSDSHPVFVHPSTRAILNLQPAADQAKPYHLRQLVRLVERYRLTIEDEP